MRGACDERHARDIVAGLRLQSVWRAARHPTTESGIDGWRSILQRLAHYLHQLRQDGVLRTRNPDDPDYDVALTPLRRDVTIRTEPYKGQIEAYADVGAASSVIAYSLPLPLN